MTNLVKKQQTGFTSDSSVNPSDKKRFSVVEPDISEPATLDSSAQRQLYPYLHNNQRHRDPAKLKAWQVTNLHLADDHASKIGTPLNVFVTVAWGATEYGDLDAVAFKKCLKRICQWLRDNGAPAAWVYVHENPVSKLGDPVPNTHMLVHIPAKLKSAFKAKLDGWFQAEINGAVKAEPRTRRGYNGPDRLQYMSKGADGFTCRRYGGYRKKGGQGIVSIKRSGVSRNLDWKARSQGRAP